MVVCGFWFLLGAFFAKWPTSKSLILSDKTGLFYEFYS